MCSNSCHSRSTELNFVFQIQAGELKVPLILVHITSTDFLFNAQVAFSVLLFLNVHMKVLPHKSQKNEVHPNPHALIFSFSLRWWHIAPSHHTDLYVAL